MNILHLQTVVAYPCVMIMDDSNNRCDSTFLPYACVASAIALFGTYLVNAPGGLRCTAESMATMRPA